MATEIERKFLVAGHGWRERVQSKSRIRQGYLSREGRASVRVRVIDGARATLTIKAAKGGFSRHEFEYPIPIADGEALLEFCAGYLIDKVRHRVDVAGRIWEIDVFEDENAGLVIAEVELGSEGDTLVVPEWAGREITEDRRYYNAGLARLPYTRWS
jgi:adenylate cyclase